MNDAMQVLIDNGATPEAAQSAVDGLARAIEQIRAIDEKRARLRPDVEIIRELQSERTLYELSPEAIKALVESALINGRLKAPWGNPAWWLEKGRIDDLRNLDAGLLKSLRVCAVATIEARRKESPNPISAGATSGTRITRRGRPADFGGHDLACACFVAFHDATGTMPSRIICPMTQQSIGAYHDFMDAVISSTRFTERERATGRRVTPKPERLVRASVEWMIDDNGRPNPHELQHFRELLN